MAKQEFAGPPPEVKHLYVEGSGWRHSNLSVKLFPPVYTYWTDIDNFKVITLWWNGARWSAWIQDVMAAEPTDFMHVNDPPLDWAVSIYEMSREPAQLSRSNDG